MAEPKSQPSSPKPDTRRKYRIWGHDAPAPLGLFVEILRLRGDHQEQPNHEQ